MMGLSESRWMVFHGCRWSLAIVIASWLGANPAIGYGQSSAEFEATWEIAGQICELVRTRHPESTEPGELLATWFQALNLPAESLGEAGSEEAGSEEAGAVERVEGAKESLEEWRPRFAALWRAQRVSGEGESAESQQHRWLEMLSFCVPGGSRWVDSEQARVDRQLRENRYIGIGIQLMSEQGAVTLTKAFWGGPAWEAKLRGGDVIVGIDGDSMVDAGLGEVVTRLRGPAGSDLSVTVLRGGEELTVEMTRREVPIATVEGLHRIEVDGVATERWQTLIDADAKIGYLKVLRIAGSTAAELKQLARQAKQQGCRSLILDLRECREANIHDAVLVADQLVGPGPLGSWEEQGRVETVRSSSGAVAEGMRVRVLAGLGSAEVLWLCDALRRREGLEVWGTQQAVLGLIRETVSVGDSGELAAFPTGTLRLNRPADGAAQPGVQPGERGDGRSVVGGIEGGGFGGRFSVSPRGPWLAIEPDREIRVEVAGADGSGPDVVLSEAIVDLGGTVE